MNEKIVKVARKVGMKLAEKSPAILLIAGVGLIGTGTIIACKRTKKIDSILEMHHSDVDAIKQAKEDGEIIITKEDENGDISEETIEFTEKDYKKLLARIYIRTGLQMTKVYAPAIACEVLGITSIGVSYRIITKRLGIAIATATGLEESLSTYRNNVIEELGEDTDYRFLNGIKKVDVEEPVLDKNGEPKVDKETGEVKTKKFAKDVVEKNMVASVSSYLFDDVNFAEGFRKDPESNLSHLYSVEALANQRLKARGFVTLAWVLDKLGYTRDLDIPKEALVIGWKYDPTKKKYATEYQGYDYASGGIHFGFNDPRNPGAAKFMDGYENAIWLTMNVDGIIYDML